MVRNTHGGNNSKGMARKNIQNNGAAGPSAQLRLPADEFEQIALVTRVLGNGMFYANNTEGVQFLGHIRNKFKGRSRRNNDVSVAKLVLIGLRTWENPHKNADLLFVYDDHDFHTLSSKFDISSLYSSSSSHSSPHDYIFSSIDDTLTPHHDSLTLPSNTHFTYDIHDI